MAKAPGFCLGNMVLSGTASLLLPFVSFADPKSSISPRSNVKLE